MAMTASIIAVMMAMQGNALVELLHKGTGPNLQVDAVLEVSFAGLILHRGRASCCARHCDDSRPCGL